MGRSLALYAAVLLVTLASFGCAKDKSQSGSSGFVASGDQMINFHKPDKKTENSTPAPIPTPPENPNQDNEDLNDSQKQAVNVTLTCQDNDCNPSVGLLSIVTKNSEGWGLGQCTASLVGSDTLVTNAHCVPSDIAAPGSSCQNRLWITFSEDSAHPEYERQIGCSQVILRKKVEGVGGVDYAYLKLSRASNRPVLRQTRGGFEDKTNYSLHKFNPTRIYGGLGGHFQKVKCLSIHDSAIFPAALDRLSQTSFMTECNVIPGNSGGPVLAEDGSLRGVIYAYLDKSKMRMIFGKNGSKVPEESELSDLNVASNFACLKVPGDLEGQNIPAECTNAAARSQKSNSEASMRQAEALGATADRIIRGKSKGKKEILSFGWTLMISTSEQLGPLGLGVPRCVKPMLADGLLDSRQELNRPFFYVRAEYDRYMRAKNIAPVWQGFSKTVESLQLKKADQSYSVEISDRDSGRVDFSSQLPACP